MSVIASAKVAVLSLLDINIKLHYNLNYIFKNIMSN
jgi:hypothetical protein